MVDAVVVGAGHNGLVCAAYLARAGLDVVVLEARDSVGGCASTVDALGARVNICSCDHTLVRASGIIEELELARHGLRYLDLDPTALNVPSGGGAPWFSFVEIDRTLASLALTYPDQVAGYRRYLDAAMPLARLVQRLTAEAPTPGSVLRHVASRRAGALPRLLAWSRLSAESVLRQFFTRDELLGPAIAVGPAVWGVGPAAPGTGLGALVWANRHLTPPGRPVGGSGALPAALAAAVRAAGGSVRTSAAVVAVACEGERVRGVELAGGELVEAPVVVSTVDPRTTLVRWLAHPPSGARRLVARWRATPAVPGYEAKLDAVVAFRPRYRGLDDQMLASLGVADALVPTAVITPGPAGIAAGRDEADAGRVANEPVLLANFPSVADPGMVPPGGGDVLSLEVLFTPYDLAGGWATSTEPRRWLAVFASHLEAGFVDGVGASRVVLPPDYERDFGLVRGHAPSFSGGPLAALLGRAPELTRYRTPIGGLFLSGAATFPGAGIWGASGRNAAQAILRSAKGRS